MSLINADWFFKIGKTHNVCEDYAYAEGRPGAAVAVLSDGCSGSSDTDFGSRLLVRSAAERLWNDGMEFDELRTIYQAAGMARQIGLREDSLDATIICAKAIKDGSNIICKVWIQGDGLIIAREKSGKISTIEIVYKSGMPAYLSYLLNKDRQVQYKEVSKDRSAIVTSIFYDEDFKIVDDIIKLKPAWPIDGLEFYFNYDGLVNYDLILLISDGIKSFQRRDEFGMLGNISESEVLRQLLGFKNMRGEFLKRRCNSFFKFCTRSGWQHDDDFSVVAIDLNESNC